MLERASLTGPALKVTRGGIEQHTITKMPKHSKCNKRRGRFYRGRARSRSRSSFLKSTSNMQDTLSPKLPPAQSNRDNSLESLKFLSKSVSMRNLSTLTKSQVQLQGNSLQMRTLQTTQTENWLPTERIQWVYYRKLWVINPTPSPISHKITSQNTRGHSHQVSSSARSWIALTKWVRRNLWGSAKTLI